MLKRDAPCPVIRTLARPWDPHSSPAALARSMLPTRPVPAPPQPRLWLPDRPPSRHITSISDNGLRPSPLRCQLRPPPAPATILASPPAATHPPFARPGPCECRFRVFAAPLHTPAGRTARCTPG